MFSFITIIAVYLIVVIGQDTRSQKRKRKDKPVIIITVDGGPDENPRYKKTVTYAIAYFNSYDLDAVFVATNAPKENSVQLMPKKNGSIK